MSAVQEESAFVRYEAAFRSLVVRRPSGPGAPSGASRIQIKVRDLLRSSDATAADILQCLKLIDLNKIRFGTDFTIYLYQRVFQTWLASGKSIDFHVCSVLYKFCGDVDRYDVFSKIIVSDLILRPDVAHAYSSFAQSEIKLSHHRFAARLLYYSACVDPSIYGRRQISGLQAQVLVAGGPIIEDRVRVGLCTMAANQAGGIERLSAFVLRKGSAQTSLRELKELVALARTINRPDLALDILERLRSGPIAKDREYWSLVKDVQRSGLSLAEGFYPFSIHLESVNACNAACVMCPVSNTSRRRRRISGELVDRVIAEIRSYPFRPSVGLHGVGEPLLHKDLPERVAKFVGAGIHVYFSTNGQLMTEQKATELLEAGLPHVIFSLETLDATVFESTRIGLSFNVVLGNIKNFLALRERFGATTTVQITLVRAPQAEGRVLADIEVIRSMLSPRDFLHLMPRHNFTGGYAPGEAADSPCNHPFVQLNMTSDGLVTACCLDSEQVFVAGDFNTQSMLEIYNGSAFRDLRRKHIEGRRREAEVCHDCTGPETWIRQAMLPGKSTA